MKSISLMQFTGLKDKNGVEIYEGDILRTDFERNYLMVEFRNGAFMINCKDGEFVHYDYFLPVSSWDKEQVEVEVIGNIHQNPELCS